MGAEEIRDRTTMIGFEAVQEAVAEGRGAILVTGHFGNWEIGGASLAARGIPMDAIAQRQRNPLFDAEVNRHRRRLDMTIVYRGGAIKKMLSALEAGRLVGIVGDQNLRKGGVFVDFFGRKAATAPGFAILALRSGAPVFSGCALREPGYPQRYRCTVEKLEPTLTGSMEEDLKRLTQAHTTWLEGKVRETPEQYLWTHRRWKTQPEDTAS
jgi:KDO2-lipid IV(A) lauroyltransferase